jgi:hypothetical protein
MLINDLEFIVLDFLGGFALLALRVSFWVRNTYDHGVNTGLRREGIRLVVRYLPFIRVLLFTLLKGPLELETARLILALLYRSNHSVQINLLASVRVLLSRINTLNSSYLCPNLVFCLLVSPQIHQLNLFEHLQNDDESLEGQLLSICGLKHFLRGCVFLN